jgi:hypothetical protein
MRIGEASIKPNQSESVSIELILRQTPVKHRLRLNGVQTASALKCAPTELLLHLISKDVLDWANDLTPARVASADASPVSPAFPRRSRGWRLYYTRGMRDCMGGPSGASSNCAECTTHRQRHC